MLVTQGDLLSLMRHISAKQKPKHLPPTASTIWQGSRRSSFAGPSIADGFRATPGAGLRPCRNEHLHHAYPGMMPATLSNTAELRAASQSFPFRVPRLTSTAKSRHAWLATCHCGIYYRGRLTDSIRSRYAPRYVSVRLSLNRMIWPPEFQHRTSTFRSVVQH